MQVEARLEHLINAPGLLHGVGNGGDALLILHHARQQHEAAVVKGLRHAQLARVALEVVPLVHVNGAALVGHNLVEKVARGAGVPPLKVIWLVRAVAQHQLLDKVHLLRPHAPAQALLPHLRVVPPQQVQQPHAGPLVRPPLALPAHLGDELHVKHVAHHAVPQVMHQPRHLHAQLLHGRDAQGGLLLTQVLDKALRHPGHPQAVLKAVVRGRGEDGVRAPQLLEPPQALVLHSVNDARRQRVQLHGAVDGVIKDLVAHGRGHACFLASKVARGVAAERRLMRAHFAAAARAARAPAAQQPLRS